MQWPAQLSAAVSDWLKLQTPGSHRLAARELSRTYRAGGTSTEVDFAAYLVARMPATYAAVSKVLGEVRRLRPGFAPGSLLDAGAGPGTASWVAADTWPGLESVRFFDNNRAFLQLASSLAKSSTHAGLAAAASELGSLTDHGAMAPAGLVIAAYALAELPEARLGAAVDRLWQAAADMLVLVEPGTPDGFARIAQSRERLLTRGAFPVAPCPHAGACPMAAPDWCHFTVRLARSRAHMHAKAARVPFEDEKFSYLAVSRTPGPLPQARIVAPPHSGKAGIGFKLCTASGLAQTNVARRDRDAYRVSRSLGWSDAFD